MKSSTTHLERLSSAYAVRVWLAMTKSTMITVTARTARTNRVRVLAPTEGSTVSGTVHAVPSTFSPCGSTTASVIAATAVTSGVALLSRPTCCCLTSNKPGRGCSKHRARCVADRDRGPLLIPAFHRLPTWRPLYALVIVLRVVFHSLQASR